ncbi:MAG TPA: oxidoreductase-like domain-containing protein [Burkholderiales bacterium]
MTEPESVANDPEPQPPREPQQWECCHSGCEPCIYDLYWEALERYEIALQAWYKRHPVRNRTPGA